MNDSELTLEEQNFLMLYRCLSPDERAAVDGLMDRMASGEDAEELEEDLELMVD